MQADINHSLQDFIQAFLQAASLTGEVTFVPTSPENMSIKITVEADQGYIIGKYGASLEALQHIVTLIARKQGLPYQYRVDVNNYQSERDALFLEKVTDFISDKAESEEILLWPMTAYERRLIHEYFLKANTYTTQSEDFGRNRVIRLIKK